jgi:Protein of unknown function (DUF3738)
MSNHAAGKPIFPIKILLYVYIAVAAMFVFGLAVPPQGRAQSPTATPAQNIADTWQGTLHAGRDLRVVFKISKADGGGYKAVSYSIDQGGDGIPVNKITLEGTTLKMTLPAINGTYEGKLSADGKTITGTFSQGQPLPLTLVRATPETEWTIPPPTPRLPPMETNASPGIEVATIKPTKPDEQGFMLVFRGGRFQTTNISLSKLLAFSYGVQQKQVIGLPPWADTDKYDIDAKPDTDGTPNKKQLPTASNSRFITIRRSYRFMRSEWRKPGQSSPRVKTRMGSRVLVCVGRAC